MAVSAGSWRSDPKAVSFPYPKNLSVRHNLRLTWSASTVVVHSEKSLDFHTAMIKLVVCDALYGLH